MDNAFPSERIPVNVEDACKTIDMNYFRIFSLLSNSISSEQLRGKYNSVLYSRENICIHGLGTIYSTSCNVHFIGIRRKVRKRARREFHYCGVASR